MTKHKGLSSSGKTQANSKICRCVRCKAEISRSQASYGSSRYGAEICGEVDCILAQLNEYRAYFVDSGLVRQTILGELPEIYGSLEEDSQAFESNKYGAYVFGPTGTGKTFGAVQTSIKFWEIHLPHFNQDNISMKCKTEILRGHAHLTAQDYVQEMRGSIRSGQESRLRSKYVSKKLLVLDDLGAENRSTYSAAVLCDLIEQRLARRRRTIITSNLTLEEVDERDPRLASRISKMICTLLEGRDRRQEEG